jgi:formate dehydrogenase major subunit
MIRSGSAFREASWEEALGLVGVKLKEHAKAGKIGGLISSLATDEELAVFVSFKDAIKGFKTESYLGTMMRGFYNGVAPFAAQGTRPFTAAHNILEADAIILLDADPRETLPVTASYIRVAALHKGAKLIHIGEGATPFPGITDLSASDLSDQKVEEALSAVKKPIVVLGGSTLSDASAVTRAVNFVIERGAFFEDGLGIVPLLGHSNMLGSINTVLAREPWLDEDQDFLYVYSTGLVKETPRALSAMSRAAFTVVQTPFRLLSLTNLADVILPAPAWYERSGHLCTLEGERRHVAKILDPIPGLKGFGEVLQSLCDRLGVKMGAPSTAPCENVFSSKISPDLTKQVQVKEA